jgi:hypothetical protein
MEKRRWESIDSINRENALAARTVAASFETPRKGRGSSG